MNDVFKLIDTDQDGKVSEDELKAIAELDSEDNKEGKDSISIEDLKIAIDNDKVVKIEDLKDATKEEFKEVARQSAELWKEIENIGMNDVLE